MSGWKRRFTRIGVALAIVMLIGATVQGVMTALERQQYPRPGQMVDVGGHQLHFRCAGEGRPAVVLDAGAMMTSAEWAWVQRDLARVTRVCSFERAGLGYSEAADAPYDPARTPDELHAAIASVGLPRPYVLAGHGLGAAFAEVYGVRYRSEVAALVLIDAPAASQIAGPDARARWTAATRRLTAMPWIARLGVLRVYNPLATLAAGLPERQNGEARMFLATPDHLARGAREIATLERTLALANDAPAHGGFPVTAITAERMVSEPEAVQVTTAVGNTRVPPAGTRHEIRGATDATILTDPVYAAQVARIIGDVVHAAARGSVPLP